MTAVTERPEAPAADDKPEAPPATEPAATGPAALAAAKSTPLDVAQQRAQQWAEAYLAKLKERTEARLIGRANEANGNVKPLAGEVTSGNYDAFDVAMTSPLQPILLPPYEPGKVIAAGEPAFIVAFTWINPTVDVPDGFAVPASVQLSGRQWRLTLDLLNVTAGTTQRSVQTGIVSITGGASAHVFALPTPDPGPDPAVMEANITYDIVDPGQPYAAFATDFYDVDNDPAFLFVPPLPPGWRHELPNRYLVYRK